MMIPPDDIPPVSDPPEFDTYVGHTASSLVHDWLLLQHYYGISPQDAAAWMNLSIGTLNTLGYVGVDASEEED